MFLVFKRKIGKEKNLYMNLQFRHLSTFKACFTKRKRQLYCTSVVLLCCICLLSCSYAWNFTRKHLYESVLYRNENSLSLSPLGPLFRPERKAAKHDIGCLFALPPFFLQNRFTLTPSRCFSFISWMNFVFGNSDDRSWEVFYRYLSAFLKLSTS